MSEEHWTERDAGAYAFSITTCALEAVLRRMRETKCTRTELARRLGVSRSAVTQMLNLAPPPNFTIENLVKLCRAVGLDLALVTYAQGPSRYSPIDADVFIRCWEDAGSPPDFWKWHEAELTGAECASDDSDEYSISAAALD